MYTSATWVDRSTGASKLATNSARRRRAAMPPRLAQCTDRDRARTDGDRARTRTDANRARTDPRQTRTCTDPDRACTDGFDPGEPRPVHVDERANRRLEPSGLTFADSPRTAMAALVWLAQSSKKLPSAAQSVCPVTSRLFGRLSEQARRQAVTRSTAGRDLIRLHVEDGGDG
jgi:hypothetical protein